jgi:hypothetical protein
MWAMLGTWLDIVFVVEQLLQFNSNFIKTY